MWAITIVIEAYEGFHSTRLEIKDEEIGEGMQEDIGKTVLLAKFP